MRVRARVRVRAKVRVRRGLGVAIVPLLHRAAHARGVLGDAVHLLDGSSLLVHRAVEHEAAQVGLHRAVELPRVELLEELVHAHVLVHADTAADLLAHNAAALDRERRV